VVLPAAAGPTRASVRIPEAWVPEGRAAGTAGLPALPPDGVDAGMAGLLVR
jgi:hypothetical protein